MAFGRDRAQPRDVERQQVAALGRAQRVQLVEDDGVEVGEQMRAIGVAEQQDELLGRRHQDVGRPHALALAAADGGVAGARLGADRQPHLLRSASSGCGQRRPRAPSAARYRACAGRRPCARAVAPRCVKADEARQEAGQRLAGAGRRDQQGRAPLRSRARPARADAGAASSPGRQTIGQMGQ